mmetsp:Transcript_41292/g.98878  ORF Transcript_41292/g.98878 Transcript_41292/m.98878 type:complete len:226 (-) Transcript_41292:307-984(-)
MMTPITSNRNVGRPIAVLTTSKIKLVMLLKTNAFAMDVKDNDVTKDVVISLYAIAQIGNNIHCRNVNRGGPSLCSEYMTNGINANDVADNRQYTFIHGWTSVPCKSSAVPDVDIARNAVSSVTYPFSGTVPPPNPPPSFLDDGAAVVVAVPGMVGGDTVPPPAFPRLFPRILEVIVDIHIDTFVDDDDDCEVLLLFISGILSFMSTRFPAVAVIVGDKAVGGDGR